MLTFLDPPILLMAFEDLEDGKDGISSSLLAMIWIYKVHDYFNVTKLICSSMLIGLYCWRFNTVILQSDVTSNENVSMVWEISHYCEPALS